MHSRARFPYISEESVEEGSAHWYSSFALKPVYQIADCNLEERAQQEEERNTLQIRIEQVEPFTHAYTHVRSARLAHVDVDMHTRYLADQLQKREFDSAEFAKYLWPFWLAPMPCWYNKFHYLFSKESLISDYTREDPARVIIGPWWLADSCIDNFPTKLVSLCLATQIPIRCVFSHLLLTIMNIMLMIAKSGWKHGKQRLFIKRFALDSICSLI